MNLLALRLQDLAQQVGQVAGERRAVGRDHTRRGGRRHVELKMHAGLVSVILERRETL